MQPIRHLDVIIQNHLRDDHLDLIRRKEASRASMTTIAERQVLLIRSDELVARVVRCAAASAQLVVPKAIELLAVGIIRRVIVNGLRGYFYDTARRDVLAVGQCNALQDAAAEGSWCC